MMAAAPHARDLHLCTKQAGRKDSFRESFFVRIPVLTYHATNVFGNDYGSNDHVALQQDLRAIHALGFTVVPASDVVAALVQGNEHRPERAIVLTMDDGSDFDYRDLPHPTWGMQRSMLNVLRDFHAQLPGAQPALHATAFVIVSPEARRELDRTCLIGRGWWRD